MSDDKEDTQIISFEDEFGGAPVVADATAKPRPLAKVLDEIEPDGYGCKFEDCVGKKITVLSIKPFRGTYGAALYVRAADENGELFHTVIGASVPARKLWQAKDALPVTCTVVEHPSQQFGKYYDLE
jgi:hypothetical protein